ncbi:hypothetical protein ACFQDE_04775 [Deinococcus caeni]|uniref:Uncharacterized protein n=1 Tax=Deinococcus caeni TaxID=569127 RepID=A0ABP9UJK0_9DEIO
MPPQQGRLHLRAALHAHETWIAACHGPTCRESLVALHRPPRPVMGALEPWRAYLRGGGPAGSAGLSFQPPVPVVGWVPGMGAQISQVL